MGRLSPTSPPSLPLFVRERGKFLEREFSPHPTSYQRDELFLNGRQAVFSSFPFLFPPRSGRRANLAGGSVFFLFSSLSRKKWQCVPFPPPLFKGKEEKKEGKRRRISFSFFSEVKTGWGFEGGGAGKLIRKRTPTPPPPPPPPFPPRLKLD